MCKLRILCLLTARPTCQIQNYEIVMRIRTMYNRANWNFIAFYLQGWFVRFMKLYAIVLDKFRIITRANFHSRTGRIRIILNELANFEQFFLGTFFPPKYRGSN